MCAAISRVEWLGKMCVNDGEKKVIRKTKTKTTQKDNAKLRNLNELTSYHVRMKEFIMLIARRYELHYEKVYNYFESQNRLSDLLIINFWETENDWNPILKFLQCSETPKKKFPNANKAPSGQKEYMIDEDIDLNWRNFEFSGRFKQMFALLDEFKHKYNNSIENYVNKIVQNELKLDFENDEENWYTRLKKMYKHQLPKK